MKYLSLDGVTYLWSKIKKVANNENILINSDFRNPVNQRTKTSYTSATQSIYTIDRWLVSREETLSIENGYVRVKRTKALPYLLIQQNVEMSKDCVPDTMTLTFKARASKKAKMQLYDTDRFFEIGTDWSVIKITFTKDEIATTTNALKDDNFSVHIGIKDYDKPGSTNLPVDTYFDIAWAKLEAGNSATEFTPRPRAEEVALCQRYYEKIATLICRIYAGEVGNLTSSYTSSYFKVLNGSYRSSKRTTPTITVSGHIYDSNNNTIEASASDFKSDDASLRQLNLSKVISNFDILITDVEVNAEIY